MRWAIVIGVVLSATLAAADVRKELEAAYTNFNAAMKARDVKKLMDLTTPDFKWINENKVVFSRMEVRNNLEQTLKQFKSIQSISTKIDKITSDKIDVISVRSTSLFKAELVHPSTKKAGSFESTSVTDDVWVKTKQGWRIKQTRSIKETSYLDGRKVSG